MQTYRYHQTIWRLVLNSALLTTLVACSDDTTVVDSAGSRDASVKASPVDTSTGAANTSTAHDQTTQQPSLSSVDEEPIDAGLTHHGQSASADASGPTQSLTGEPRGAAVSESSNETSSTQWASPFDAAPSSDVTDWLTTHHPGDGGVEPRARLVVADPEAWTLYVYDIPSLELVGQYEGVHASARAGFVPLDNGRVAYVDDQNYTLNAHDVFGPIPGDLTLMVPLASPPVHFAIDPAQHFAAVSGAGSNGAAGLFTLVNLQTSEAAYVAISTGESSVLLGGDPLLVYHRNDNPPAMETYAFDRLWVGQVDPLSNVALGAAPNGEVMAHAADKIFSVTDEGVYVIPTSGTELAHPRVVPYAAGGRSGGRASYTRLSSSGHYVYSNLCNDGASHDLGWRDWDNDVFIVDVHTETATRVELGKGLVYRFAESARYAIFAQLHPDGDFAHFLDTDPSSPTFHTVVGKVPLPAMSKAPASEGATPWESEAFRLTGILPSGRYAFVTQGGDGEILVIDTDTMDIAGTITTPTPLNYGGHIVGMELNVRTTDTSGR